MIDQSHINLLNLIPTPLKRVGMTGGGEYHGPCPFCGGKDRFIVHPNDGNGGHWWCRQCDHHGDALAFVMQHEQLDFKAACARLSVTAPETQQRQPLQPQPAFRASDLRQYACFEAGWQSSAVTFCYDAAGRLWDAWQGRAGEYLEGRGISLNMARAAFLGLNEHSYKATWGSEQVWLPRGIVIPWQIDGELWNARVRRPNADLKGSDDKYISPKGSAGVAMYRAGMIQPCFHVVMVEGEFDALVLQDALNRRGLARHVAISIGSNTGARLQRWVGLLYGVQSVVLAFDADEAGDAAAGYWSAALGRKARRLRPFQKDITDMWRTGELAEFVSEVAR